MDKILRNSQIEEGTTLVNGWEEDNLSMSSDLDVDSLMIGEEEGVFFEKRITHDNCIEKQEYESEKQKWESENNSLKQQLEQTNANLETTKAIVLEDQKQIDKLKKEKEEIIGYKETFEKLQDQIVTLNTMLCEANNETDKFRYKVSELEQHVQDLEDKLYGPTNYYYKLYLEVSCCCFF